MQQQLVLVPIVNGQFAILNKTYYENIIKNLVTILLICFYLNKT